MHQDLIPCIIAVAGGTSSGKTEVTNLMVSVDTEKIIVVRIDSYYIQLEEGENPKDKNFDDPSSIDWELFKSHLIKLKNT